MDDLIICPYCDEDQFGSEAHNIVAIDTNPHKLTCWNCQRHFIVRIYYECLTPENADL